LFLRARSLESEFLGVPIAIERDLRELQIRPNSELQQKTEGVFTYQKIGARQADV
jgi:hypothetical protein